MTQQVDDVLDALADEQRREVVRYLSNHSTGATPIQEIAEHVASRTDATPEDVSIHLDHAILPALDERDLLEYDRERGVIQYQSDPFVEEVLNSVLIRE